MSALERNVLQNSVGFLRLGWGREFWPSVVPLPIKGVLVLCHRHQSLTRRLRWASSHHRWRGTAEELGKPSQVLSSCREQHLVSGTAQASQPKSVELEDALHMSKLHLNLLALAA
jgi:hypothetical protein